MISEINIYAEKNGRFLVTDGKLWAGTALKDEILLRKYPRMILANEYLEQERQHPDSWFNRGE